MKTLTLLHGEAVLVDDEDFEYLQELQWRRLGYYAVTSVGLKNFYMHKMIMRAGKGQIVDHRNGNPLDNRKENLRFATKQENQLNQKIRSNNTTGFKGVHLNKKTGKYVTQIGSGISNKHDTIGTFDTAFEAALAYNIEAIKRFGQFAKLNQIKELTK